MKSIKKKNKTVHSVRTEKKSQIRSVRNPLLDSVKLPEKTINKIKDLFFVDGLLPSQIASQTKITVQKIREIVINEIAKTSFMGKKQFNHLN